MAIEENKYTAVTGKVQVEQNHAPKKITAQKNNTVLAWWKWVCILLLVFSVAGGLLVPVPRLAILNETIRNLFYHVPMWFAMIAVLTGSLVYSIKFLSSNSRKHDMIAEECARVGVFFGILGLITGSIW